MEWIITCKINGDKGYRIFDAFSEMDTIDWHRSMVSKNIKKNDIVYIYVGSPYMKIMFKTKCIETLITNKDLLIDDGRFYNDKSKWGHDLVGDYFRLKLIKKIDDEKLSLTELNKLSLITGNIQGSFKSENNPVLFQYIDNVFNKNIEDELNENYEYLNKPRIKTVDEWIEILKEEQKHTGFNFVEKVLVEVYNAPNRTIFCSDLENKLGINGLNWRVGNFRDRIKKIEGIKLDKQIRSDSGKDRAWNIPFTSNETINNLPENKGKFCWILRDELALAMEQVIPNLKKKRRILFCNIAYMKSYDSSLFEEIPVNGGSYVTQTNDAYEKNNFHVHEDGFVRGFVETKYVDGAFGGQKNPKQLRIENIDSQFKNQNSIDNVLVVFCAHSPMVNKTVIVGWYKNAIVLRNREIYNNQQYNLITDYKNAILLKEHDRTFEVPRAAQHKDNLGLGQANVWYANKPEHSDFVNNVLKYIDSTTLKESNRNTRKKNTFEDDKLNNILKTSKFDTTTHFEYTNVVALKPEAFETKKGVIYYKRERKIAMNAISHAQYMCEYNKNHESFIRKNDGVRYTEAHHLIPMAYQGDFEYSIDIEENIVSLCSNCHNEIHYGANAEALITKLYNERKEYLKKKKIDISLEKLLSYYK